MAHGLEVSGRDLEVSYILDLWTCVALSTGFHSDYIPNFHIFHMLSGGDSRAGKVFRCSQSNLRL